MKVIDLLNKIANGEEVPKKIMYNNIIYNWDIVGYLHYEDEYHSERAFLEGYRTDMCLNDEVEIIEDTPKEDISNLKWGEYVIKKDVKKCSQEDLRTYISLLMETQNKIIDYLKSKGE